MGYVLLAPESGHFEEMESSARVRALASCSTCGTVTVPAPSMTVRSTWDLDLVTVAFECPTCERPGEVRASLERARTLLGDPRVEFEIVLPGSRS